MAVWQSNLNVCRIIKKKWDLTFKCPLKRSFIFLFICAHCILQKGEWAADLWRRMVPLHICLRITALGNARSALPQGLCSHSWGHLVGFAPLLNWFLVDSVWGGPLALFSGEIWVYRSTSCRVCHKRGCVFHCCITNQHTFSGLKQQPFIISQFLEVSRLSTTRLSSLLKVSQGW